MYLYLSLLLLAAAQQLQPWSSEIPYGYGLVATAPTTKVEVDLVWMITCKVTGKTGGTILGRTGCASPSKDANVFRECCKKIYGNDPHAQLPGASVVGETTRWADLEYSG